MQQAEQTSEQAKQQASEQAFEQVKQQAYEQAFEQAYEQAFEQGREEGREQAEAGDWSLLKDHCQLPCTLRCSLLQGLVWPACSHQDDAVGCACPAAHRVAQRG